MKATSFERTYDAIETACFVITLLAVKIEIEVEMENKCIGPEKLRKRWCVGVSILYSIAS